MGKGLYNFWLPAITTKVDCTHDVRQSGGNLFWNYAPGRKYYTTTITTSRRTRTIQCATCASPSANFDVVFNNLCSWQSFRAAPQKRVANRQVHPCIHTHNCMRMYMCYICLMLRRNLRCIHIYIFAHFQMRLHYASDSASQTAAGGRSVDVDEPAAGEAAALAAILPSVLAD